MWSPDAAPEGHWPTMDVMSYLLAIYVCLRCCRLSSWHLAEFVALI